MVFLSLYPIERRIESNLHVSSTKKIHIIYIPDRKFLVFQDWNNFGSLAYYHQFYSTPLLLDSDYTVGFPYINKHLETILPALFRKVTLHYERQRILTRDDDFLDLDWIKNKKNRLVILTHGLEGDSRRSYIKGMAKYLSLQGYDILAWNFRGCSEEMNLQKRFYHSGETEDLKEVIDHGIASGNYHSVYLIGFSLGGNMTLKLLGEKAGQLPKVIKSAVTFSVPMDLYGSSRQLYHGFNKIYTRRFLKSLTRKIKTKSERMPGTLDLDGIDAINCLMDFDERYTAPLHGFQSAMDYYEKCSSLKYVSAIQVPTLIINAKNDPFLSESCYPYDLLKEHDHVHFEYPDRGGHCGFSMRSEGGFYWSEKRAFDFIRTL